MESCTERKPYQTDLSDAEWAIIEPLIPGGKPGGRPRETNVREVVNAIFYLLRTGCAWRHLPHDFPPPGTVYDYFWSWTRNGTLKQIHDALRRQVRVQAGREAEPSAASIDSQSTKTNEQGGVDGYDAGKKIMGRKRHILVDTMGLILAVVVHSAGIQDRDGAKAVFERIRQEDPERLKLIWADGGYAGRLVEWVKQECSWILEIVKRSDDTKGFKVLPRRWVVERTFAWLGRFRRMSKDYEFNPSTSEAMIHLAMINVMIRRLAAA
jgi:putative transposase